MPTSPTPPRTEPGLSLYLYEGCSYCDVVRRAAARLGVLLEERDIFDDAAHLRALVEARGRRTVPVLRIEGEGGAVTWLPESRDIVRYLEGRFGERGATADASGITATDDPIGWLRRLGRR